MGAKKISIEETRKEAEKILAQMNKLICGKDFAKMVMDGENKGLFTFGGETVMGTTLSDGLEHEEFYPDPDSVVGILQDLFSLVVAEEDEDEDMTEEISEELFSVDEDDEDLDEDLYDDLYDDLYEDETRSE